MGQIGRIDLSTGSVVVEKLKIGMAREYIGGTGFAARILWDELKPQADPLGPDNILVIATGPSTGTLMHASGRFMMAAKSPLTHFWGESHGGGHWGPELKYAGFDALVIYGRSEKPVYLLIDDGRTEIRSAEHLWGLTVSDTVARLKEELGDTSFKILAIGPAGENLVRFASVMTEEFNAVGRTGMGAVMGSKKLKAIVVRGSKSIVPADIDKYLEVVNEMYYKATKGTWGDIAQKTLGTYGTVSLVEALQAIGRLPTKNHYTGIFPEADKICGETIRKSYRTAKRSCFCCFIQCKYIISVETEQYKLYTKGPEYETVMALGSNTMVSNSESIFYANYLCNEMGMDTISTGKVISWVMECFEKGLITKEDVGFEVKWGDHEAMIRLVKMIAHREGFGKVLAEGVKKASEIIGRGTEKYAIHVKGLEVSGQDGRAQYQMGLEHAVSVRGADHLRGLSTYEELGFLEPLEERYGKELASKIADRLSPDGKPFVTIDLENFYAVVDSVITCKYSTMWPPIYYWEDLAKVLKPLTGIEELGNPNHLRLIGDRIHNLRKAFNIREGWQRKDDNLPERFTKEPMPEGPAKGHTVPLESMIREYYELRGWDPESGLPKKSKLEELELKDVSEYLASIGRLVED